MSTARKLDLESQLTYAIYAIPRPAVRADIRRIRVALLGRFAQRGNLRGKWYDLVQAWYEPNSYCTVPAVFGIGLSFTAGIIVFDLPF